MKVAKAVFEYLQDKPTIKHTLNEGLINYSALARKIEGDLKLEKQSKLDAIMVACKRFSEKTKPDKELNSKIVKLVKNGKFELKNKTSAFVIADNESTWEKIFELAKKTKPKSDNFHIIQGTKTITLIIDDEFGQEVEKILSNQIVKSRKNLIQITHKTSEKIEQTPGFLNYLTSIFFENGINIYECMSSWTDSIFLVDEKDAQKIFKLFS